MLDIYSREEAIRVRQQLFSLTVAEVLFRCHTVKFPGMYRAQEVALLYVDLIKAYDIASGLVDIPATPNLLIGLLQRIEQASLQIFDGGGWHMWENIDPVLIPNQAVNIIEGNIRRMNDRINSNWRYPDEEDSHMDVFVGCNTRSNMPYIFRLPRTYNVRAELDWNKDGFWILINPIYEVFDLVKAEINQDRIYNGYLAMNNVAPESALYYSNLYTVNLFKGGSFKIRHIYNRHDVQYITCKDVYLDYYDGDDKVHWTC